MRLYARMGWAVVLLWVTPSAAALSKIDLAARLPSKADVQVMDDGFTLQLWSDAVPRKMHNRLDDEILVPWRVVRTHEVNGSALMTIRSDDLIRSAHVKTRRDGLTVSLNTFSSRDALSQRLLKPLMRSVPSAFLAPRFAKAERALRRRDVVAAERRFTKLANEYALRGWSRLRLADIAVMRGNDVLACQRYAAVRKAFGQRSTGVLAELRLHLLKCPSVEKSVAPWPKLAERLRFLGGPIAQYLRKETLWGLSLERDPDNLAYMLHAATVRHPEDIRGNLVLSPKMLRTLVGRLVRVAPSVTDRAEVCLRYQGVIDKHPEYLDLYYTCALAFDALDVGTLAASFAQRAADRMVRRGEIKGIPARTRAAVTLDLLERAYRSTGQFDQELQTRRHFERMKLTRPRVDERVAVRKTAVEAPSPAIGLVELQERLLGLRAAVGAVERSVKP